MCITYYIVMARLVCPQDNRRSQLNRWHICNIKKMLVDPFGPCMYVCMVITYSRVWINHAYKSCTTSCLWGRLFSLTGFEKRLETFGNCNSTEKSRNKCIDQDHTVLDNILSHGTYGTRSVSHSLIRMKSEFIRSSVKRGQKEARPKLFPCRK